MENDLCLQFQYISIQCTIDVICIFRFDPVMYNMLENQQNKPLGRNDSRLQSEFKTNTAFVEINIDLPPPPPPNGIFQCQRKQMMKQILNRPVGYLKHGQGAELGATENNSLVRIRFQPAISGYFKFGDLR